MGSPDVDSSSSLSDSLFSSSSHDHLCFSCLGELHLPSSSSSSTFVSWEDTISSIGRDRVAGESEIELSGSTYVPNDVSGSVGSSGGGTSARLDPYVRVTRFFGEAMGDKVRGGEEVGGAVLGEFWGEDI
jgi:hypothetical protein